MNITTAIRTWYTPAPDSEAARNIRKGKSPWVDAVHLLEEGTEVYGPMSLRPAE